MTALPTARAVFIDKDGTLVENVPYNVDPALLRLTPNALEGLRLLQAAGYRLIVVTNQPGIAYGWFGLGELENLSRGLTGLLAAGGVALDGFFFCPHSPTPPGERGCPCRKPAPGLLQQAAQVHRLNLAECWMVGDILDDIEAGRRSDCRTVLLDVGNETEWKASPLRVPHHRVGDLREAASAILADGEGAGARVRPVPQPQEWS